MTYEDELVIAKSKTRLVYTTRVTWSCVAIQAWFRETVIASEYLAMEGLSLLDLRFWERPFGLKARLRWAERRLKRRAERVHKAMGAMDIWLAPVPAPQPPESQAAP